MAVPFQPNTFFGTKRAFGGATVLSNEQGYLLPQVGEGRLQGASGLVYSDVLLVDPALDIRDGCSRVAGANAITYADGDEVDVHLSANSALLCTYVVVFVEHVNRGKAEAFKRLYLLRDAPTWGSF